MIPVDEALMALVLHSVAAKPDPAPRPTVAARSLERAAPKPKPAPTGWAAGDWGRFPAAVEASARCIAKHESWHSGLWKAENPTSTASGAFQFIDSTWQAVARRAGIGTQYRHASDAPPRIQAAVFAHQAINHGLYPWKGTGCPGT